MVTSRVVLHVGLPKCGSSYLQQALASLPGSSGVSFPGQDHAMFLAALDVTRRHRERGRTRRQVDGQWAALCAAARAHSGTTVISSELLTYAGARRAAAALEGLAGLEVDVVVTVRDLASLLPSRWQQTLKGGRLRTFPAYLERAFRENAEPDSRFWRNLEPRRAARAWGADLPPERVHVVTIPRGSGSERPGLLWERFAAAARIPAEPVTLPARAANRAMGMVEAELVRRVNAHVSRHQDPRAYAQTVKRLLVKKLLVPRGSSAPAVLPEELVPGAVRLTEAWRADIEQAGWDVVGDLDELTPAAAGRALVEPSDEEVLELATRTIADLLGEVRRLSRDVP